MYHHCAAAPQKAVSDTLLSARFNRYARENPIEKLYLHQDRTNYYAGETIWFKVYQTLSSSATEASRIVYIDLSNSKGEIVKQVKYPLADGAAPVAFDPGTSTRRPLSTSCLYPMDAEF